MNAHKEACLRDAATKQYDGEMESAKQFGCPELKEVFTAEKKTRCRLDASEDEDGKQRLPNVEIVPPAEPVHVMQEKNASSE